MDLKKNKKKLKKRLEAQENARARFHVYRSADKNATFAEWERITKTPVREDFTDQDAKRRAEFYYYKLTEVGADGRETAPYDQNTFTQNGRLVERTPETAVMGNYIYWSTDPDLPRDQWTKSEELITDENAALQSPVKETFYVYSVAVNFLGNPIGSPSGITKVIYKGKP